MCECVSLSSRGDEAVRIGCAAKAQMHLAFAVNTFARSPLSTFQPISTTIISTSFLPRPSRPSISPFDDLFLTTTI